MKPGVVVHACSPSSHEAEALRRITVRPACIMKQDPVLKRGGKKKKKATEHTYTYLHSCICPKPSRYKHISVKIRKDLQLGKTASVFSSWVRGCVWILLPTLQSEAPCSQAHLLWSLRPQAGFSHTGRQSNQTSSLPPSYTLRDTREWMGSSPPQSTEQQPWFYPIGYLNSTLQHNTVSWN